ncbi:hypothetical protein ACFWJ4_11065 [Kitasatospora sp. NPDC127067]|uniref:hypothetical protein n=1 Tax=Kitasatospora sp. NPDC127067 TaxID=3347126 RepID=UPI003657B95D
MQFGISGLGEVTVDPATGRAASECERIRASPAIAPAPRPADSSEPRFTLPPAALDAH